MILFENVSKEYQENKPVVSELNFEIQDNEFFVLIGPSGSGKTTTLKMINRLISLTKGYIRINGKMISEYKLNELRWNIGYVLQQIALFPHMTIEENITIVPEMKKWSKYEMKDRVTELLESVGLDPDTYRNRKPSELSGGEQQRIGIVRALAADPDIILMDEPFSALDPISRAGLQQDLLEMKKKLNKTIVFVTHDISEALLLGDRICLFNKGKVVQIGTPKEIVQQPADDFVRSFLKAGNVQPKYQKTVADVIQRGYINKELTLPVNETIVTVTDPIEKLMTVLSMQTEVAVVDDQVNVLGTISQQQFLSYLSQDMQEGENE